jgi:hypothetical protein
MQKYKLSTKYNYFQDSLLNIKEIFRKNDNSIHEARNVLKIIPINGEDIVVKAFRVPNIINQFAYSYIRNSKANKSFFNALKLQELGLNTPTPIGFIEFYENSLLKESFFLSKYYYYEFTMANVRDDNIDNKNEILEAFAKFSYTLHKKGVWHVDYSGGNILINRTDNTYEFSLVDINRMEFKTITSYDGLKNFNKLWLDENDLKTIATAYAKVAKLDEKEAIRKIILEDKKLKEHVLRRRKIKAFFKGKN